SVRSWSLEMTVLSEVDSVSRLIGRDAATTCCTVVGGAGLAVPPACDAGCCGLASAEAVGSAGPPVVGGFCGAAGAGAACSSQIIGGSRYFFSATLSENFCAVNFCVLSKFENQHCQGGSAIAEIT